jgi:hypothetical protein
MADDHEDHALEYIDRIATMSDDEVRRAYCATTGEPGDPWADALANACEERGIDI